MKWIVVEAGVVAYFVLRYWQCPTQFRLGVACFFSGLLVSMIATACMDKYLDRVYGRK